MLEGVLTLDRWWPVAAPAPTWTNDHSTSDFGIQFATSDGATWAVVTHVLTDDAIQNTTWTTLTVVGSMTVLGMHLEEMPSTDLPDVISAAVERADPVPRPFDRPQLQIVSFGEQLTAGATFFGDRSSVTVAVTNGALVSVVQPVSDPSQGPVALFQRDDTS
ncbi:MAG TPA: hypothetical protein PLX57_05745 [Ornithinibacter sp.]|jgi:hypothetical protein|uniref:hypothetical protein n=1 Tax=Ornithinibacter sp. TaxID=2862748 RepID=UPI002C969858|nr:hypothetical protein [Ornithinibacter sp.]HQV82593.1 hypothetical protein [Ornithinibacter sp.]HQW73241.1 hypothetical protein [Ornithinibacter sp.]HQX87359.1 hypothetical protein [Ornithinibacter sp.]HQZ08997.1 hypothetical protein [Ornithinibacter sp.]HRA26874.1 hypothetical protein [Ornithinibacter sp.]